MLDNMGYQGVTVLHVYHVMQGLKYCKEEMNGFLRDLLATSGELVGTSK